MIGLLAINCFCISEEVLISFSFLKDNIPGYRVLGWLFYSFSILNMSSELMISEEKLAVTLIKDSLLHDESSLSGCF